MYFCSLIKENMFCFMLRIKADLEIKEAGTATVTHRAEQKNR